MTREDGPRPGRLPGRYSMRHSLFKMFLLCALVLLLAQPCFAQAAGQKVIASGELGAYYAPSSGSPIPGEGQVVFDGTRYMVCETTADRLVKAYWFSWEGKLLKESLIADLSGTDGDLSQPSACVAQGMVFVAYVAPDGPDYDADSVQYIAKISYADASVQTAEVCGSNVKPRRPGMASDGEGILLVYRDFDNCCFARYIGADLSMGTAYQVYQDEWDSFAIYPWVTYAEETGQFLVLVQQYGSATGALVTKDTDSTPEPIVIIEQSDYYEQPRAAWNGEKFLVAAQSSYGIVAAELDPDGTAGDPFTLIPYAGLNGDYNIGMLAWNGSAWLAGYSQSRDYSAVDGAGKTPDFRWKDTYLLLIDPETYEVVSSAGIGTGWWHQLHLRFALGPDGDIFCTYLENGSGPDETVRWCLLRGDFAERRSAAGDSGLSMTLDEELYGEALGSSNGKTAFADVYGQLYGKTAGGSWESLNVELSDPIEYYDISVSGDGIPAFSGWAGLAERVSLGGKTPQLEGGFCVAGEVPATGVWSAGGGELYVCSANGKLWHCGAKDTEYTCIYDYGKTGFDFHDIHGSSTSNIYAVGDRGLILHYDGKKWSEIDTPVCTSLNAVYTSGGIAWAAGDDGTVLCIENGVCTLCETPVRTSLTDLWGYWSDLIFACGEKGTVLTYDGSGWKQVSLPESSDPGTFLGNCFGLASGDQLTVYAASRTEGCLYSMQVDLFGLNGPLLRASAEEGVVSYILRKDVSADAQVLAAAYDRSGRMTAVAAGKGGKAVLPAGAVSIRVFLLDSAMRPLCGACEL